MNKFYATKTLLNRFTIHLRNNVLKNVGSFLTSFLDWGLNYNNSNPITKEEQEENYRKMILGKK